LPPAQTSSSGEDCISNDGKTVYISAYQAIHIWGKKGREANNLGFVKYRPIAIPILLLLIWTTAKIHTVVISSVWWMDVFNVYIFRSFLSSIFFFT
jgi:hypothetical protein